MHNGNSDRANSAVIRQAIEEAWESMKFAGATGDRALQLRDQIASAILELASGGERNAGVLCHEALRRIPPATAYYARQVHRRNIRPLDEKASALAS